MTGIEAQPTAVEGCVELRAPVSQDRRGSFVKILHRPTFDALGLDLDVAEIFVSTSSTGVVRGLHFQRPPAEVAKLVCCLAGTVVDAVVDLREGSPTRHRHATVVLSAPRANAVFVPRGCAHGFLVTEGPAIVAYAQSGVFDAAADAGVLWSSAGVDWGVPDDLLATALVSERDGALPTLDRLGPVFGGP